MYKTDQILQWLTVALSSYGAMEYNYFPSTVVYLPFVLEAPKDPKKKKKRNPSVNSRPQPFKLR